MLRLIVRRVPVWIITALLTLSGSVWCTPIPLVVGGVIDPPFKYLDEHGEPTGLDVDLVTTIMAQLQRPVRVALTDAGARLLRNAANGDYDMVLSLSRRPEREAYLLYPAQSHLKHSWHFFIRSEDRERIHFHTLDDLKPWRIGLTRDYAYTAEIADMAKDPAWQVQWVSQNELQLRKLAMKRIDVAALQYVAASSQIEREKLAGKVEALPLAFRVEPYFNVWCKARAGSDTPALMQAYDTELERMKRDGRLRALYARYHVPYLAP